MNIRKARFDAVLAQKFLLALSDAASLALAFFLSFMLRNYFFAWRGGVYEPNIRHKLFLGGLTVMIVLFFRHNYLYRRLAYRPSMEHLERLVSAWLSFVAIFITIVFFLRVKLFIEHRITVFIFMVLGGLMLYIGRFLFVPWLTKRLSRDARYTAGTLCISSKAEATRLAELIAHDEATISRVIGYVSDDRPDEAAAGPIPWLGRPEDLPALVEAHRINEVFIRLESADWDRILSSCRVLMPKGIRAYIALNHFGSLSSQVPAIPESDYGYVFINESPLRRIELLVKRAVDFTGSALGLVALSPLFLLLGAMIRMESPGPVFFRQKRVGRGGRAFDVFKFRTMRENTEEHHREAVKRFVGGETDFMKEETGRPEFFKVTHGAMVTRTGAWLRRTGLDELPQLINVFRGEMSLIGPRPLPTYEVELFQPWQQTRHDVRPGITGFWQVFGRSAVSHRDAILMDVFYILNWSLALDFRILARTVFVVLTGKGGL